MHRKKYEWQIQLQKSWRHKQKKFFEKILKWLFQFDRTKMKNRIESALIFWILIATMIQLFQLRQDFEKMNATVRVLETKFETKIEYLDVLSWRKAYTETLREELESIARESN